MMGGGVYIDLRFLGLFYAQTEDWETSGFYKAENKHLT